MNAFDPEPISARCRAKRGHSRRALIAHLALQSLIGFSLATAAHASVDSEPATGYAYHGEKVMPFELSVDLRHLPIAPASDAVERPKPMRPRLPPPARSKPPSQPGTVKAAPPSGGPRAPMPPPTQNFPGVSRTDTCGGTRCGFGWPPDPNGDVGPNHYILAVNTSYAIYSKTGTLLTSFSEDALFAGTGANPCNGDAQGDPIVLYDWLADRWILTHFAFAATSPYYQCIAASKTSDPVSGGWWLYPVRIDTGGFGMPPVGVLNDYAKFGLWHDCLYFAANGYNGNSFAGVEFGSFSRSDLYSGAPLTYSLGFLPSPANDVFTMIPSHSNGKGLNAAQPGTPDYFVSESPSTYAFHVRKFTPGLNCGGTGALGAPTAVSQAHYPVQSGNIVPQPNVFVTLDMEDDRLMQKAHYRKVGNTESLWVTHPVGTPAGNTAMQWAQIDVTGGAVATTPVQEQIYAPDNSLYRFMGSLAVDNQGNMALGYSTSNGSAPNFPSIAYSGRLATDPLNTLPQTEVQLVAGLGSQNISCSGPCERWGDYSSMSVDPADDCTFWYANQYYSSQTNGDSGNWQTRIGSFKFPSCSSPSSSAELAFTPVTPCRLIDTRNAVGAIAPRSRRSYSASDATRIAQAGGNAGGCGIPPGPSALALTLTAILPDQVGNLIAYPAGSAVPLASALNFVGGQIVANTTIVPITAGTGDNVSIYNNSDGSTPLAVDIVGYFWEYAAADCGKTSLTQSVPGSASNTVVASCGAGFLPVGGGCSASTAGALVWLDRKATADGLGYGCAAFNTTGSPVNLTTDTLCCRKAGR